MAQCKSCKAQIVWRKHAKSRLSAPIDVVPKPGGNITILDGQTYDVVTDPDEIARRLDLHWNHFATCPTKAQHKKGKS